MQFSADRGKYLKDNINVYYVSKSKWFIVVSKIYKYILHLKIKVVYFYLYPQNFTLLLQLLLMSLQTDNCEMHPRK